MDILKGNKNTSYSLSHIVLFLLMMMDFIFTYIGVNNLNVIVEANPILIWLFKLPFLVSFTIRAIYSYIIVYLCKIIQNSRYKHYKKFIIFCIGVNVFVLILHLKWLLVYLIR